MKRKTKAANTHKVLSLFTGAGGFDIGLEMAGFNVNLCIENDPDACATIRFNRPNWKLSNPGNVFELDCEQIIVQADIKPGELSLLAAGPPCQPYSKSSYWYNGDSSRLRDPRSNTLVTLMNVIESTLPEVVLIENVKGISYAEKDEGLKLIISRLDDVNKLNGTNYIPIVLDINAADYGVPQIRERVFIIAHREGKILQLPGPTHYPINKLKDESNGYKEYVNTWDAIGDLDTENWPTELNLSGKWAALLPSIPEGENYQWHTSRSGGEPIFGYRTRYWSFLLKLAKNRPSWTIQATPGPSTGPFHWKNRRLSIREVSRLQTIPDNYHIQGSYRSALKQLGNAVPSVLGEMLGLEIRRQFFNEKVRRKLKLLNKSHNSIPPKPERVESMPKEYDHLKGEYRVHPGTGNGPRAKLFHDSKKE